MRKEEDEAGLFISEEDEVATSICDEAELQAESQSKLNASERRLLYAQAHPEVNWMEIYRQCVEKKRSYRSLSNEFGIPRARISKFVTGEISLERKRIYRKTPLKDKWRSVVQEILEEHQKQKKRPSARQIYFDLMKKYGYVGSERTIRYLVSELLNGSGGDRN